MNNNRPNDAQQNRAPAECVITVNGNELKTLYPFVREVTIRLQRQDSGTATLLFDSFRNERGQWSVQDSGLLHPWDEVQINASFGGAQSGIIHGYIREIKQDYPDDMGAARVTVEVQDDLLKLDREQIHTVLSREGEEKTDNAIAKKFAEDAKMEKCVTDVTLDGQDVCLRPGALHINTTPVKFLRERAEANGFELYTRDAILYFRLPQLDAEPQPKITVYAGPQTNCINFALQHDGHRPDKVRLAREAEKDKDRLPQEFEPKQNKLGVKGLSSEGKGLRPFVWTIDRPLGATEAEVEKRAQAKANENQFKIKAQGVLDGTIYGHVLLPHLPVEVDGIGPTYGGTFYVDAVTHQFTSEGYRQEFKLIKNAIN